MWEDTQWSRCIYVGCSSGLCSKKPVQTFSIVKLKISALSLLRKTKRIDSSAVERSIAVRMVSVRTPHTFSRLFAFIC